MSNLDVGAIKDLATTLAIAEQAHQRAYRHTHNLLDDLKQLEAWQQYDAAVKVEKELRVAANDAKEVLRDTAVELFKISGCKGPIDGVLVRENAVVEIDDPKAARDWAIGNAPYMLNLSADIDGDTWGQIRTWIAENYPHVLDVDQRELLAYVKRSKDVPGASLRKVPSGNIARDMSQYLPDESVDV